MSKSRLAMSNSNIKGKIPLVRPSISKIENFVNAEQIDDLFESFKPVEKIILSDPQSLINFNLIEEAEKAGIIKVGSKIITKDSEAVGWFYTWNNIPESKWKTFSDYLKKFTHTKRGGVPTQLIDFSCYQIEIGEKTATIHAQGMFTCHPKKKWSYLMNNIARPWGVDWNLRPIYSNNDACFEYVTKERTRIAGPFTFGLLKEKGEKDQFARIGQLIRENGINDEVRASQVYARNRAWCQELHSKWAKAQYISLKEKEYLKTSLTDFQKEILSLVLTQDDRTILWIYNPEGNIGKSWLQDYMYVRHNACLIELGDSRDIFENYDDEDIGIVNIVSSERVKRDTYAVLEKFRDGTINKTKWHSKSYKRSPVKICVLSNEMPDTDSVKEDRWLIVKVIGDVVSSIDKTILRKDVKRTFVFDQKFKDSVARQKSKFENLKK